VTPETNPLPPDRKRDRSDKRRAKRTGRENSGFHLRTEAYKLFGVDVTQIPGLETMAFQLFGEVGRDMKKWPTADHFASWQGLCPDNDISGGRVLWKQPANFRTGLGNYSGEPPIRCTIASLPWEIISVA
jgi:hypothetical protein